MKQFISKIIDCNYFLKDFIYKIYAQSYNSKMILFTKEISEVDSIERFYDFAKFMKNIPDQKLNSTYTIKRAFSENTLYGYAMQLIQYAGYNEKNMIYFPIVEHGIPYGVDFNPMTHKKNLSYIFQGRYAENGWMSSKQKGKAYFVGPYIHYCEGVYNVETIKKIKEKNGRTLLIFLPHTCEVEDEIIDIAGILNKYDNNFLKDIKTVLACVYCFDVNKIKFDIKYKKNINYVSAGFKTDPLFVRRLRSILELSDVVVFDSFSSSIGYAYYLEKEIFCSITEKEIQDKYDMGKIEEGNKLSIFRRLFSFDSRESDEAKRNFVDKYWGLSEIKTKQQIKNILEENKKSIVRRMGF